MARPLEGSADDIFCLKEERKVAKDHTITLDGVTYTLPSEPCLVAFQAQCHICRATGCASGAADACGCYPTTSL